MDLASPNSLPTILQTSATHQDLVAGQVLFHRTDTAQFVFAVIGWRLLHPGIP
jgi:hypothetical protein